MHLEQQRRRREIFGAAAVALECNDDADRRARSLPPAAAAAVTPALPSPAPPRRALVAVAAQLALLCVLMAALEGLLGNSTSVRRRLMASDADDDMRRVARALPALVVLHVLLDKSALDALWALQLLVASKIHKSALFPDGAENAHGASSRGGVAALAFALMLLSYPLVRFYRRATVRPWVAALLLFTLAESAVLAFVDDVILPTKRALLFNCSFLACSTFVMAALMRSGESSTPTVQIALFAVGATSVLASYVRAHVGVSESAFMVSLAGQLVLTLVIRKTLTRHSCEEAAESAVRMDATDEDDADEGECSSRSVFRFVVLLATVAIAVGALAVLVLVGAGLRRVLLLL